MPRRQLTEHPPHHHDDAREHQTHNFNATIETLRGQASADVNLFITARSRSHAQRITEQFERRARLRPAYVQAYDDFTAFGWFHYAGVYARQFDLSQAEERELKQFLRYWVVVRRCCGRQLSQDYRAILKAKTVGNPAADHPEDAAALAHTFESEDYNDCHIYNLGSDIHQHASYRSRTDNERKPQASRGPTLPC